MVLLEKLKSIKKLSLDEFLKEEGATPEIFDAIKNSKEGYITIRKIKPCVGIGHSGHTVAFGEGIACYLASLREWYQTSTIQSIDWENKKFNTLNSVYEFDFAEDGKNKS